VVITGVAPLRHGSLTGHLHPATELHLSAFGTLGGDLGILGPTGLYLAFSRAPVSATSAARKVECALAHQRLLLWMKADRDHRQQDVG
jgi:hypothetical protein